jgi:NAD(P)-dependent dehydrogenase (short-subunit alcohol dehydrogenase family)
MASTQKEVALIVGASRGIGRQIAIDLAREGYAGIYSAQDNCTPP